VQPRGFDALTGMNFTPPKRQSERPSAQTGSQGDHRRALKEARESLHGLRAEERKLRNAARTAAHVAERAETEARRKREEADYAQKEADEARARIEAAEAELEQLRRRPLALGAASLAVAAHTPGFPGLPLNPDGPWPAVQAEPDG